MNNRNLLALIIILEHSFFLLQEGKQRPGNVLAVAAAKYKTSQTRTAVEEAVKEVLRQDDGDDEKLCSMVETIILSNRMCECHNSFALEVGACICAYWFLFRKGLTGRLQKEDYRKELQYRCERTYCAS